MTSFTIPGRLPGLNEYTAACRANPHVGAKMKRDAEATVTACILAARVPRVGSPYRVHLRWIEASRRRDPDNVRFGVKFILDALVAANVVDSDGWKHVGGINDVFEVDADDPRIEVELEAVSA